ncbi:hypothetical protein PENVUL_c037G07955 [Penicillium vulpinum]|uniref:Uncharacterized protein n=1 Tax=Penicillium vulpinum TaxID=29845 RepID=A0A1V6RM03_9EURO|nr:hypothetical protein PENVUL_c037G07955 [Penicillium vulpinum]
MSNLTITLWQILDLKDQPLIGIIVLALLLSVYLLLPRKNDSSKYNVFKLCCPHGEQWVLPVKFLDELKSLPENKISLAKSLSDQFLGPSTYVGTHDATVLKSISDDLARNVANIIQTMDEEAVYALSARIPECKD